MITIFRRFRQKLIASGSMKKYLLYAIGEILLVVVGILIALQVNNWNEERIENNQLKNYYQRIIEELASDLPMQREFLEANQEIIDLSKRTLHLLNMNHPDSLAQLEHTLGAVATSWGTTLSYPVYTEFIKNGYLSKVDNPVLKQKFFELNAEIEFSRSYASYVETQYQTTIEPYVIRSFNYQTIALDRYQDMLVPGGPKIDYTALKDDLELWNIASLKLELSNLYRRNLNELMSNQQELTRLIRKEL